MTLKRTIYRDMALSPATSEYLSTTVTSWPIGNTVAVDLNDVVQFTFDRVTYNAAAWVGAQWDDTDRSPLTGEVVAVKRRIAQLLMTDANLPTTRINTLLVRVTDNPEAPIVEAGTLIVQ